MCEAGTAREQLVSSKCARRQAYFTRICSRDMQRQLLSNESELVVLCLWPVTHGCVSGQCYKHSIRVQEILAKPGIPSGSRRGTALRDSPAHRGAPSSSATVGQHVATLQYHMRNENITAIKNSSEKAQQAVSAMQVRSSRM